MEQLTECNELRKTLLETGTALKNEILIRDEKIRSLEKQLDEKESEIMQLKMGGSGTSLCSVSELLPLLYEQRVFELGEYVLKSGVISPIYVDMRILVSSIETASKAAEAIVKRVRELGIQFDYVLGVPYGAIPLGTLVAFCLGKPMLLKRKEPKGYGKNLMIEGRFEAGKRVLVIEDVVTSGASIGETIEELKNVRLVCEDVICLMDREQGGVENLRKKGIALRSILTMSSVLDFLVAQNVIDAERKIEIQEELRNPRKADGETKKIVHKCGLVCESARNGASAQQMPNIGSLQSRQPLFEQNPLNKRLVEIILKKRTNLCLALDLTDKEQILKTAEKVGDYVCAIKLHSDSVNNFDVEFVQKFTTLSKNQDFIIFEDRKFGDTGETMTLQLTQGLFNFAKWVDVITVHAVPGSKSIGSLAPLMESAENRLQGALIVAQMSTEGSLTDQSYINESVKIASENESVISGFICQKRCHTDPKFLYWTPGVNASNRTDGKGQRWRSVEQAIIDDGCDIIIVGRGITQAPDMASEAKNYAMAAWEALNSR